MPSNYLNQCRNIVDWILGNKHQWNLTRKLCICIQENAFENVVWKMAAILSRPQCVNSLSESKQKVCILEGYFLESHWWEVSASLQCRHHERDGVRNHQRFHCLLSCLIRCRSKETSKLRITDLSEGNPLVTGAFPSQKVSYMENVSIWWRHHGFGNHDEILS